MKSIAFILLLATATLAISLDPKYMAAPIFKKMTASQLQKTVSNLQWTDCDGTGNPYVEIKTIQVIGDVSSGNTLTIHATGNVKQTFTVDNIDVIAYLGVIKLYSGNIKLTAPISGNPGPEDLTFKEPLTVTPPNGNYKVTAKFRDASGHELQCLYTTATLS